MTQATMSKTRRDAAATNLTYGTLATPVGRVAVAWRDETVVAVFMAAAEEPGRWDTAYRDGGPVAHVKAYLEKRFGKIALTREDDGAPIRALRRYFEGDVHAVDTLKTDPGGTELQAAIWSKLREIPAGTTMTYGELARAVGRPSASRAAGRAVGTNPISIVIPCHRVVGSNGSLTGFGGGLERKKWLLGHEGALRELV